MTRRTWDRVEKLIRRGPVAPPAGRSAAPGRGTALVRCTSTTPAGGSGLAATLYPGVIVVPSGTAPTLETHGPVWLTLIDSAVTAGITTTAPTVGQTYPALIAGAATVGASRRPRAIAAVPTTFDPDASGTVRGWVSTGPQTFAGLKTFAADTTVTGTTRAKGGVHVDGLDGVFLGPVTDALNNTTPRFLFHTDNAPASPELRIGLGTSSGGVSYPATSLYVIATGSTAVHKWFVGAAAAAHMQLGGMGAAPGGDLFRLGPGVGVNSRGDCLTLGWNGYLYVANVVTAGGASLADIGSRVDALESEDDVDGGTW